MHSLDLLTELAMGAIVYALVGLIFSEMLGLPDVRMTNVGKTLRLFCVAAWPLILIVLALVKKFDTGV